ncbi:MAG: dTMP kinase [Bifidobacteriaceae bacterium]|jgi:dTMP kinase|nr:dTMP kinase [Bifidobacteriaceae bacterium]
MFITFEGIDASGKSTQATLLAKELEEREFDVLLTKEPGGTELGKTVRNLVLHGEKISPRTEALLFLADKAEHVDSLILPALKEGKIVISDRYLDSSIAYQAAGRHFVDFDYESLGNWAIDNVQPDVTFFIDIDPSVSFARMLGKHDKLENEGVGFQRIARYAYLEIAKKHRNRFIIIDANGKSVDELHAEISEITLKKLGDRK